MILGKIMMNMIIIMTVALLILVMNQRKVMMDIFIKVFILVRILG